jgi:hypothetical protein
MLQGHPRRQSRQETRLQEQIFAEPTTGTTATTAENRTREVLEPHTMMSMTSMDVQRPIARGRYSSNSMIGAADGCVEKKSLNSSMTSPTSTARRRSYCYYDRESSGTPQQACEQRTMPTLTPTAHRRSYQYCYYDRDRSSMVSSAARPAITATPEHQCRCNDTMPVSTFRSAAIHQQQRSKSKPLKANINPGYQTGGCQVLLPLTTSSSSKKGSSNNTSRRGAQRRMSLSNAGSYQTKNKTQQRRQSFADVDNAHRTRRLSASGDAARSQRRSSSSGALYMYRILKTNTGLAPIQNSRANYDVLPAAKNKTQTHRQRRSSTHDHDGTRRGSVGCLEDEPLKSQRRANLVGSAGAVDRGTCSTTALLPISRRRSLIHAGGGTGAETHHLGGGPKLVHRMKIGRRRSLGESVICLSKNICKKVEEKRNSWSHIAASTFHKDNAASKVSEQGFLQLMQDQDWFSIQKQYLDTELGSMVLLDLVVMDHSKFQELLAAGQPGIDVAAKSSAPTLLHLACSQTAPMAVVQRMLSLAPCNVYGVNTKHGNGQNVLHVAAHHGCSSRVLDLLIQLAPELAAQKDDQGRFPLHYLCMPMPLEQKPELALSLLSISSVGISNIHLDNHNGMRLPRKFESATHRMLTLKMVNQFCHAHPKAITTTDHHTGMSPLMYAVTHGAHAGIIDRMMKVPQVQETM